jgi:hypothetical protein
LETKSDIPLDGSLDQGRVLEYRGESAPQGQKIRVLRHRLRVEQNLPAEVSPNVSIGHTHSGDRLLDGSKLVDGLEKPRAAVA